ncbi:MAG: RnfABCDGE type electron transport complex subunit C [Brevinemataceae bacterium]
MIRGMNIFSQNRCRNLPIKDMILSDVYFIPFHDQMICSVGDKVEEGQNLIQDNGSELLIHSPVSGEVHAVQNHHGKDFLVLKSLQSFSKVFTGSSSVSAQSSLELIDIIRKAGITASSSNTEPTFLKLKKSLNKVHTVIVNAVQKEPFLCTNYRLILEKGKEIIQAAQIIRDIVGAQNIIIAVNLDKELKNVLEQLTTDHSISFLKVSNTYPMGYERFLIKLAVNIELAHSQEFHEAACMMVELDELIAVYDAVFYNKPMIDRVITVDGAFCLEFGNFRVKIGTPISQFMRPFAGVDSYVVINGGPMRGKLFDKQIALDKTVSGILIFENELNNFSQEECIQCSACTNRCPMHLNPSSLYDMIQHQEFNRAQESGLLECIDCNICSYVCPSFIPLGREIFSARNRINFPH